MKTTTTKDNIRMDFSINAVGPRLGGVSDRIDTLGFSKRLGGVSDMIDVLGFS